MEKKTFKDNPALQFITTKQIDEQIQTTVLDQLTQDKNTQKISTSTTIPKGYKPNPMFVETKTKRLQLVLQPSLYERVKARANAEGLSVNEFIHRTLDQITKEV